MTQIENGMIVGGPRNMTRNVRTSKCSGAQSAMRCGRRGI